MPSLRVLLVYSSVSAAACASRGSSAAGSLPTSAVRPPNSGVAGTWRLVEFWDRDSTTGRLIYLYGERPTGYFVYDATGHITIQIMRGPGPFQVDQARGEDWFLNATPDELRRAAVGFRAYFGTYSVDPVRSLVVHQVEGDSRGLYTGTRQIRRYRLAGDSLIIGDDTTVRRVLLRVR